MRSEHLSNLHLGWVAGGWLVALAVTSVVFLALVGTGLLPAVGSGEVAGSAAAIAVGFFGGGFFVGLRWSDAPVLHGVAITVLSVVVWFSGVLLAPGAFADTLRAGDAAVILGAVLVQLIASVAGGLTGRALVLKGHTPDPTVLPPEA